MEREGENSPATPTTSFTVLPEGSMSDILSLTSPRDACIASSVSRGFKSLADSDAVWERFLPPDYQSILSRAVTPLHFSTKEQLSFRLCNSPIVLDSGKMCLPRDPKAVGDPIDDRSSAKEHEKTKTGDRDRYMLGARELSIACKDTLVFWRWGSLPESRFSEVAKLLAVCWLEIKGKIVTQILSPKGTYVVYLVFNFAASTHGLDLPAKTLVKLVREGEDASHEETNTVYLRPQGTLRIKWGSSQRNERMGGWMEIEMGEFFYDSEDDREVEMCFMETGRLTWKSGLIVEGIDIRPKEEA